jgi:hypothetical protein
MPLCPTQIPHGLLWDWTRRLQDVIQFSVRMAKSLTVSSLISLWRLTGQRFQLLLQVYVRRLRVPRQESWNNRQCLVTLSGPFIIPGLLKHTFPIDHIIPGVHFCRFIRRPEHVICRHWYLPAKWKSFIRWSPEQWVSQCYAIECD